MQDLMTVTFKRNRGQLLGFIRTKLKQWDDAEDVLQDVFIQVLKNPNAFILLDNTLSWMYKVASHKIADYYRRKSCQQALQQTLSIAMQNDNSSACEFTSAEMGMLVMEERCLLLEAIASLPAEQADVVRQHVFEGKSFEQISLTSQVPVNTLLARKRYGIIAMKRFISEKNSLPAKNGRG